MLFQFKPLQLDVMSMFSDCGVKVSDIPSELELAENQTLSDLNKGIIFIKANAEHASAISKAFCK